MTCLALELSPALGAVQLWFKDFDTWPLLMALLVSLSCALLGTVFLVRRTALLGDAVSHSVLPGIAGGLLLAGIVLEHNEDAFGASPTMLFILAGAVVAGLASAMLIEALHRHSRIKPDTALAAVFPAFFASGIILIRLFFTDNTHFDENCVYFGALEHIGYFSDVAPTFFCSILVVIFFLVFYKEILITSFDRQLSGTLGLPVGLMNLLLVSLLALAVVVAFEAVGAILVIALLIIPPATAQLLSYRFNRVLILSALCGLSAAFLGSWMTIFLEAVGFKTLRAPTIAVVASLQFLLALVFSPEQGLLAQALRKRALESRILEENLLGSVYRLGGTPQAEAVTLEEAAARLGYPPGRLAAALRRCRIRGELTVESEGILLTEGGSEKVAGIIRGHRLWESYMIHEMGAASDHVHDAADHIEHHLQPALVKELEKLLGNPNLDPHGSEIP